MSGTNGGASPNTAGQSDKLQLPVPPASQPDLLPSRTSQQNEAWPDYLRHDKSPTEQNGIVSQTVQHAIMSRAALRTSIAPLSPCTDSKAEEKVMDGAAYGVGKHAPKVFQGITAVQSHCVPEPSSELIVRTDASRSSEAMNSVIVHQDVVDDGWDAVAQQPERTNSFKAPLDRSTQHRPGTQQCESTEKTVSARDMRQFVTCWPDGVRDMPPIMTIFCVVFFGMVTALMFMLIITGMTRAGI